jgi:hypothetical protein
LIASLEPNPAVAVVTSFDFLMTYLRDGQYDKLDAKLAEFEHTRERRSDGWPVIDGALAALERYLKDDPSVVPNLEAWQHALPASYYPVFLHAQWFMDEADYVRGPDYAEFVPKESWGPFHEDLAHAREELLRAHAMAPEAAVPCSKLLWIAMEEKGSWDEKWHWFQEATRFDPENIEAHQTMLEALKPKWGGSFEAMFRFARESVAKHPGDPNLQLLIPAAHREMAFFGTERLPHHQHVYKYYQDEQVWKEVREAYERYLAAYPEALGYHNWFARTAMTAGDRKVLRREMAKIQGAWQPEAWDGSYEWYERARRLAEETEEQPSSQTVPALAPIAQ